MGLISNKKYRKLKLTQGQAALVDTADFDNLNQYSWQAIYSKKSRQFYAVRTDNQTKKRVWMHRQILGLPSGDKREGDHINPARTLDNRRQNLRIASHGQNQQNARLRSTNKSGYKGVCWSQGYWLATIGYGGKQHSMGSFKLKRDAINARKEAVEALHKEFGRYR